MSSEPADVAVFIPFFAGGGAERVVINLAQEFARQGVNVDFLVCRDTGPLRTNFGPGIRLHQLRVNQAMLAAPELAAYLVSRKPRSLLSTLIHANVSACAGHFLSRSKSRLVIRLENTLDNYRDRPSLAIRLALALAPSVFRRADKVIAVSEDVRADAVTAFPKIARRLVTINNPVDIQGISRLTMESSPHPWLSDGDMPVIISAGRLVAQKDYATLIRAFALVRGARSCRLVILGEGEELSSLLQLADDLGVKGDVLFPGFVQNPYAWISRAKLFVLTSRWEGFGNVLTEALACGVPIVGSDCVGGIHEILDEGGYGILAPVGDAEAFARAISSTLDSKIPSVRLRSRAAQFDLPRIAEQYLRVLLK